MGLLNRMGTVIKAKMSKLIDAAEDPQVRQHRDERDVDECEQQHGHDHPHLQSEVPGPSHHSVPLPACGDLISRRPTREEWSGAAERFPSSGYYHRYHG